MRKTQIATKTKREQTKRGARKHGIDYNAWAQLSWVFSTPLISFRSIDNETAYSAYRKALNFLSVSPLKKEKAVFVFKTVPLISVASTNVDNVNVIGGSGFNFTSRKHVLVWFAPGSVESACCHAHWLVSSAISKGIRRLVPCAVNSDLFPGTSFVYTHSPCISQGRSHNLLVPSQIKVCYRFVNKLCEKNFKKQRGKHYNLL